MSGSKTSCVRHPENSRFIMIHTWQLEFCRGNQCAAVLLSFFEGWHNTKLDESEKNSFKNKHLSSRGEHPGLDESLVQYHSEEQLEDGVMIYKRDTISKAIELLQSLGALEVFYNQDKRYKWDRTRHFIFHPEVINSWIDNYRANPSCITEKSVVEDGKIDNDSSRKNPSTIPYNPNTQTKTVVPLPISSEENQSSPTREVHLEMGTVAFMAKPWSELRLGKFPKFDPKSLLSMEKEIGPEVFRHEWVGYLEGGHRHEGDGKLHPYDFHALLVSKFGHAKKNGKKQTSAEETAKYLAKRFAEHQAYEARVQATET